MGGTQLKQYIMVAQLKQYIMAANAVDTQERKKVVRIVSLTPLAARIVALPAFAPPFEQE